MCFEKKNRLNFGLVWIEFIKNVVHQNQNHFSENLKNLKYFIYIVHYHDHLLLLGCSKHVRVMKQFKKISILICIYIHVYISEKIHDLQCDI